MHAVGVTFTGADADTRGSDICLIAERARDAGLEVEVALLWSFRGHRPRYPSGKVARELRRRIVGEGMRCAVHLCGHASEVVRRLAADGATVSELYESDCDRRDWVSLLSDVVIADGRVQVNVRDGEDALPTSTLLEVRGFLDRVGYEFGDEASDDHVVVGQHRGGPWPEPAPGVAWLHDCSGGRGLEPSAWPDLPDYPVGLAGGLGPNLSAHDQAPSPSAVGDAARLLARRAGGWVDMQSRIRANGRLDAGLCCMVLNEVAEALAR